MNLARTEDNFKSIISYSSPAMGRKLYAEKNYPENQNGISLITGMVI